jgi:ubiquinone/menaquinone biosynthesis C-methylase UbiE
MLKFEQFIEMTDKLEEANILISALELRMFTHLGKKFCSVTEIAKKLKAPKEGIEAILNALVAIGAARKQKGQFANTSETYKNFCESSPHYKKGTVFLRKENRSEWENLISVVKNGRDLEEFEGGDDPEFRDLFTYAMHERSLAYAKPLAEAIARNPVGNIADLGGGPGSYSAEILRKDKKARATLIDRPAAIKVAKEILGKGALSKRFSFIEGDFFEIALEEKYDSVLFSNILHIYNESENKGLFKKIYKALNPGGRLLIVDLFLNDDQTSPYNAALFSLTMLMYTKTGRTYTFSETEATLNKTGFGKFKRFKIGKGSSLIEAIKL